jgi:hypothetical protein
MVPMITKAAVYKLEYMSQFPYIVQKDDL